MSVWKKCSMCKNDIKLSSAYYVCSVSTCNSKRTGYVFCSVPCFERHLPMARHRDAAAIEKQAPAKNDSVSDSVAGKSEGRSESSQSASPSGQRRIVSSPVKVSASVPTTTASSSANDILVVASKLKAYIKDQSDMNTAQEVMFILSDLLRIQCDRAIEKARADGRKTVMRRDFT
jgi:hypothetical protein